MEYFGIGELNPEMLQSLLTEHRTQQAELISQGLEDREKQNRLLTKRLEQGQRLLLVKFKILFTNLSWLGGSTLIE